MVINDWLTQWDLRVPVWLAALIDAAISAFVIRTRPRAHDTLGSVRKIFIKLDDFSDNQPPSLKWHATCLTQVSLVSIEVLYRLWVSYVIGHLR